RIALLRRQSGNVTPSQEDATTGGREVTAEEFQEGGFSATGRAEKREEFARRHRERNVPHDGSSGVAERERFEAHALSRGRFAAHGFSARSASSALIRPSPSRSSLRNCSGVPRNSRAET